MAKKIISDDPELENDKAEPETASTSNSRLIRVKSGLPIKPNGGDEVVLFERDARHPGGEAYVAGATEVEVFPTALVISLLRDERLIEV